MAVRCSLPTVWGLVVAAAFLLPLFIIDVADSHNVSQSIKDLPGSGQDSAEAEKNVRALKFLPVCPASPRSSSSCHPPVIVTCVENRPLSGDEALQQSFDLSSLQNHGCPLLGLNDRMGRCTAYLLLTCGVAVYASDPRLRVGKDEMSVAAIHSWSQTFRSWSFAPVIYHFLDFNWMARRQGRKSPMERWSREFRPHKEHFCENIMPDTKAQIPCTRPANASCECPWEIMPEMCDQLLIIHDITTDNHTHVENDRWLFTDVSSPHACLIRFGGDCPKAWPSVRCEAFQALHQDYVDRRKVWNCPPVSREDIRSCLPYKFFV